MGIYKKIAILSTALMLYSGVANSNENYLLNDNEISANQPNIEDNIQNIMMLDSLEKEIKSKGFKINSSGIYNYEGEFSNRANVSKTVPIVKFRYDVKNSDSDLEAFTSMFTLNDYADGISNIVASGYVKDDGLETRSIILNRFGSEDYQTVLYSFQNNGLDLIKEYFADVALPKDQQSSELAVYEKDIKSGMFFYIHPETKERVLIFEDEVFNTLKYDYLFEQVSRFMHGFPITKHITVDKKKKVKTK